MSDSAVYESVGVAPGRYVAEGAPRARYRATLGVLVAGILAATLAFAAWDRHTADAAVYRCPPDCGRPPNAVPVAALPRFEAPDGAFSVGYPPDGTAYSVSTAADGVRARYTAGDGGLLRLLAEPARGRPARQVVTDLLARRYPSAGVAYQIPNAAVGYQPGYGVVAGFQRPGLATPLAMRVVVMAAVKNDLALIGVAEGPFRRFTPDFGPGPPSAANLEIAMDMGKYVESFLWAGDPPR